MTPNLKFFYSRRTMLPSLMGFIIMQQLQINGLQPILGSTQGFKRRGHSIALIPRIALVCGLAFASIVDHLRARPHVIFP